MISLPVKRGARFSRVSWVATQSRAVQIEHASRAEWRRTWPLVASAGTTMGLTDTDLDALFAAAGAL